MISRSVSCIAQAGAQADSILAELLVAEIAIADLSILYLDGAASLARDTPTKAPPPELNPARPAAERRRVGVSGLAGIAAGVLPGSDRLMAAGPVAAVFRHKPGGEIAGGLVRFGLPGLEASLYERRITEGCILISIRAENPDQAVRARTIFVAAGAETVRTLIVVTNPSVRREAAMPAFVSRSRPARVRRGRNDVPGPVPAAA